MKAVFPVPALTPSQALERDLRSAAYDGNLLKVVKLLGEGVSCIHFGLLKDTALHNAAQKGHGEICRVLIQAGADPRAQDQMFRTPLHWAASNGHLDACDVLIAGGANVHAHATFSVTPLHLAAEQGQRGVCMLLIQKGARTDCKSKNATPLAMARRRGHLELVDEMKAMVNSKRAFDAMNRAMASIDQMVP